MQQNCQITRCARQHMMDSVLKSAKLRRDLTGNRNGFTHARPALGGRVSPKMDELLGDKFANRISNNLRFRHFWHNRNTKSDSDRWSYQPINCISTKKYTVHRGSCRFSAGVDASVTWHTQTELGTTSSDFGKHTKSDDAVDMSIFIITTLSVKSMLINKNANCRKLHHKRNWVLRHQILVNTQNLMTRSTWAFLS